MDIFNVLSWRKREDVERERRGKSIAYQFSGIVRRFT
jgi:hypothetical protein